MTDFTIVLPAKNEAKNLRKLLPEIQRLHPHCEIIVVDDGSDDDTAAVCQEFSVACHHHPYSLGNGAAIKSGVRLSQTDITVFMDADGQHNPSDIRALIDQLALGHEMAVGARTASTQASLLRRLGNLIYNRLASYMTGHSIPDLTSGFRAVRTRHFERFLYLLPNGFSYPTTSTMAFFRSGLPVSYVAVSARERGGKSHIRLVRDGMRFLMIILRVGTLFSPMRFFLPVSGALFAAAISYYGYTYLSSHRLTNMTVLLAIAALLTFMMGLLAELISALHYKEANLERRSLRRGKSEEQLKERQN